MSDKNKKLDGISHGKAVRRTTPLIASQPSNNTNVYKDIETTKLKLRNLAERWIGVNKIKGFLTELWETLGINKVDNKQQKGGNPSRYAAFILQDGTILTITIRASAHNARAKNYLKKGNVNGDINLSIVLQKRSKKNRFEPNENVRLIEYVYLEDRISDIENPLSQIAMSLVGYLTNGQYIDTTGVAITPSKTEQIKEYKTNINMSKNKIRITENELKQIVAESVKNVLNIAINEGKTINNKPYFKGHFNTLVNPGKMSYGKVNVYSSDIGGFWTEKGYEDASDASNAVEEGKLDKKTYLEWIYEYGEIYDNYISQRNKHNERVDSKYKEGKPTFGEEWFNKQYKKSKKTEKDNNRAFLKMLKVNNISKEEFKELPPEKKRDCWLNYHYSYDIPEEPVGYWDNALDNARSAGRVW